MAQTRYEVPGWGAGELWTAGSVVVASEFDFGVLLPDPGATRQDRVVHRDTRATCLDARPDPAGDAQSPSDTVSALVECVRAFLAGEDVSFADVELDLEWCTEFQRSVVVVLRGVPRGEVVTYGELAALAGHPGAQRAVGSICAQSRFSFFVPCHRVVAADGIGGYGSAGADVKRRLLALEGVSL